MKLFHQLEPGEKFTHPCTGELCMKLITHPDCRFIVKHADPETEEERFHDDGEECPLASTPEGFESRHVFVNVRQFRDGYANHMIFVLNPNQEVEVVTDQDPA